MSSAKTKKSRQGREDYKPYSELTRQERIEILDDTTLRRFMPRLRNENWKFMKTAKGWVTKP